MGYKIIPQKTFLKEIKRLSKKYHSLKQDLQKLHDELSVNPNAGVDLGFGIRKVRMSIADKHRGKSHGARVITYNYIIDEAEGIIYLIYIYDKNERDNISIEEIKSLVEDIIPFE